MRTPAALLLAGMLAAAPALVGQAAAPAPPAPGAGPSRSDSTVAPPGVSWRASVEPREVTVGDRFASGLAVVVPAGTTVRLELAPDSADRWRALAPASAAPRDSARTRWLVMVQAVAWQPGFNGPVRGALQLTAPSGASTRVPVTLAFPRVRAVLPDDSARWLVRPPHDVWGASSVLPARGWLGLLLALLGVLLLAAAWRLLRRRRRGALPATARERALARLDHAERAGWIEAGNWTSFYTAVAEALRGLAAALDPGWSADLSTTELLAALREGGARGAEVDALAALLAHADLAKFARRGSTPDAAHADLQAARRWVREFSGREVPEPVGAGPTAQPR